APQVCAAFAWWAFLVFFPVLLVLSRLGGGPGRRRRYWGYGPWSGWSSGVGPFGGGGWGGGGGFGGGGGGFGGFGGGRRGGGGAGGGREEGRPGRTRANQEHDNEKPQDTPPGHRGAYRARPARLPPSLPQPPPPRTQPHNPH